MIAWYWILIGIVAGYFAASIAARFANYNVLNYIFGYAKEAENYIGAEAAKVKAKP